MWPPDGPRGPFGRSVEALIGVPPNATPTPIPRAVVQMHHYKHFVAIAKQLAGSYGAARASVSQNAAKRGLARNDLTTR